MKKNPTHMQKDSFFKKKSGNAFALPWCVCSMTLSQPSINWYRLTHREPRLGIGFAAQKPPPRAKSLLGTPPPPEFSSWQHAQHRQCSEMALLRKKYEKRNQRTVHFMANISPRPHLCKALWGIEGFNHILNNIPKCKTTCQ